MPSISLRELVPVLQVAVSPVILISGVGLLLLTLTNRFGRAVDRARHLLNEMRQTEQARFGNVREQVDILHHRAGLLRLSITLAALSLLLASILIIVLFLTVLMKFELGLTITILFITCLVSLIVSLVAFISDIHLSLVALRLELGAVGPDHA